MSDIDQTQILHFLRHLLRRFVELREESKIAVSRLHRISLEQYDQLMELLMSTPSGGRYPVILIEATLNAIKCRFDLPWEIEVQDINVADVACGRGGDITGYFNAALLEKISSEQNSGLAQGRLERQHSQNYGIVTAAMDTQVHTAIGPAGLNRGLPV